MSNNDIEAAASTAGIPPPAANELTPLVCCDSPNNDGDHIRSLSSISSSGSVTSTDEIKEELERPWPATFERGIQILASPMLDVKRAADYTKSPSVRARYTKVRNKLGDIRYVFFIDGCTAV